MTSNISNLEYQNPILPVLVVRYVACRPGGGGDLYGCSIYVACSGTMSLML